MDVTGSTPDFVAAFDALVAKAPPSPAASPESLKEGDGGAKVVAPVPAVVTPVVAPAKVVAPPAESAKVVDDKAIEAVQRERKKLAADNMAERQKVDADRKALDTERAQHAATLTEWTAAKSNARSDPDAVFKAAGLLTPEDRLIAAQKVIAEHSKDPRLQKYVLDVEKHRETSARAERIEKELAEVKGKLTAKEQAEVEATQRAEFETSKKTYTDGLAKEFEKVDAEKYPLTARLAKPELLFDGAMAWVAANKDEDRDPTMDEVYALVEEHFDKTYDDGYKAWLKQQKKAAPAAAPAVAPPTALTQKADEKKPAPVTLTSEHAPRTTPRGEKLTLEDRRRLTDESLKTGDWAWSANLDKDD